MLEVHLYRAGNALAAQLDVQRLLAALPSDYRLFDGDVEVEIGMHSGTCSPADCGRTEGEQEAHQSA